MASDRGLSLVRGRCVLDHPLERIRATRIYLLAAAQHPPAMNQVDAASVAMDALPPADHRYFEILADILSKEPADREDFTMRGLAASLGIVPGQRFAPDEGLTAILDASAAVGGQVRRDGRLQPERPHAGVAGQALDEQHDPRPACHR
jgi:hypothetical protein